MDILKFIAAGVVIMIVFIIFMEMNFTRRDNNSGDKAEDNIKKDEKAEKAESVIDQKTDENDEAASG